MKYAKKWLCTVLAALMLLSSSAVFAGCSDPSDDPVVTSDDTSLSEPTQVTWIAALSA